MKYCDYKSILDAEILEFIKKTEDFYPKNSTYNDPNRERKIYNNLCKFFKVARPKGVETVDFEVSQIRLRKYYSKKISKRIVLFVHGGGWVVGDLESHDDICAEISSKTDSTVYAIDYRLAPENKHPAGLNDCEVILEYIRKIENKNIRISEMWAIINKENDFNVLHIHPNCYLSSAYYVKAKKNCGKFEIENPNLDNDLIELIDHRSK